MSYALVVASVIEAEGALPYSARRLSDGATINDLKSLSVATQQSCGWYQVVDVTKPPDTATDTTDRTLTLPGGIPTVTWVSRPQTSAELAATAQRTVRDDIESKVAGYITAADTFLALASPTNAETLAQVKKNTRAIVGIIRQARAALLVANTDT